VAERIRELAATGCTVLVATHDMDFVRTVAHQLSLLFDGVVGEPEPTEEFFARSWMWRP
jgi:energy-coupling factor transport system ATP-binding protein